MFLINIKNLLLDSPIGINIPKLKTNMIKIRKQIKIANKSSLTYIAKNRPINEQNNMIEIAFMDINPISKGHVLVVPKTQVDYIFDFFLLDLRA